MYLFAQGFENQRESSPAKSPKAGELTGSSWIKLPKRLIIHKEKGLTLQKNELEINVISRIT